MELRFSCCNINIEVWGARGVMGIAPVNGIGRALSEGGVLRTAEAVPFRKTSPLGDMGFARFSLGC
jgi:hypothetical protein